MDEDFRVTHRLQFYCSLRNIPSPLMERIKYRIRILKTAHLFPGSHFGLHSKSNSKKTKWEMWALTVPSDKSLSIQLLSQHVSSIAQLSSTLLLDSLKTSHCVYGFEHSQRWNSSCHRIKNTLSRTVFFLSSQILLWLCLPLSALSYVAEGYSTGAFLVFFALFVLTEESEKRHTGSS